MTFGYIHLTYMLLEVVNTLTSEVQVPRYLSFTKQGTFTFVLVQNLSHIPGIFHQHPNNQSLVTYGQLLPGPLRPPQPVLLPTPQPPVPPQQPPVPLRPPQPVVLLPPSQPPVLLPVSEVVVEEAYTKPPAQPVVDTFHAAFSNIPSCGVRGSSQDARIVGGASSLPGEFPWQVSLQILSGTRSRHICGGAVLSSHWVITAAHCVWELKPSRLSIVAGDHDLYAVEGHEQRKSVARIVLDEYQKDTFSNDIALLQLASPLLIDNKWVSPICLPETNDKFLKGNSVVAGWGRLSETGSLPHVLQHVTLPILSLKRCHYLYKKAGFTKFIHDCQLCSGFELGGLDSCQGDSGGPLACKETDGRYYLCGIVSWGVGCARPKFPGVYTEVTCFVEWIKQILSNPGNLLANAPSVVSISRGELGISKSLPEPS